MMQKQRLKLLAPEREAASGIQQRLLLVSVYFAATQSGEKYAS